MSSTKDFSLSFRETILYFGINSTERISRSIKGFRRALIVTGKTSAKKSGALDDILKILNENDIEYTIYDSVTSNPTVDKIEEITEKGKIFDTDLIIAIGGGSVIDSAKFASVILSIGGNPVDYIKRKIKPVSHTFLVAINLTHGTGTEVDRYAVATISETKEKLGSSIAYPNISVDNPRYMVSLSPQQTLFTSIDAFYHALESSIVESSNPYVQDLSEKSAYYIKTYIQVAMKNPSDIEARYWLLYASMLAGISIDLAGTSIIHGMEHGLSGVNPSLEHGAGLAIIGPLFLPLLYKAFPENSWKVMKVLDPSLRPTPEDAEKAGKILDEFQKSIGFNYALKDYGFDKEWLKDAVEAGWRIFEPRIPKDKFILTKEQVYNMLLSRL
ncbi:MAG: iron-containing alcohol dehydrogenase [Fervidicoccus fontis]